ncbi:M24 family metallopeptidase [Alkaliphilus peptidifermentans]|uniref:Metallopeptidase family M24 n=1 Tax=Alkaliphilus peptidifermentans DSM 18978 TaxID=1120976 RepID=A0A1G5JCD2_9FIRM|nr:M24 family metallopeptidase [Alkaliphilus peptidifermentans]SCY85459.1 Metallopeptidase family M24 [Alkaliphilus peptidifermentans DSM 18978]
MRKSNIKSIKEQYKIIDDWLKHRLEHILPELMKREKIDMWIVIARENNEDPIFKTLIPALQRSASRLSCLVFSLDDEGLDCISLSRPTPLLDKFYRQEWNVKEESQWDCLRRLVTEREPLKIGINISDTFAPADGLTKSLYEELANTLGEPYKNRIVSAEKLSIGWLETRSSLELKTYPEIYKIAIDIIEEAFSLKVIVANETTTDDVEWWIMEKINELGLTPWFTPTIDLQRKGNENNRITNTVINHGDLLHCDVGIHYLGLATDTQRLAYVLKPGEKSAPTGIKEALRVGNVFQDIVAENFIAGCTGNEIFNASLREAENREIKAMLYTHPIGYHGHGVGPTIGMWDQQGEVPIRGEYPLFFNTCYALELNTTSMVPEWDNKEVAIFLEETIAFTRKGVSYLPNRQTELYII